MYGMKIGLPCSSKFPDAMNGGADCQKCVNPSFESMKKSPRYDSAFAKGIRIIEEIQTMNKVNKKFEVGDFILDQLMKINFPA